MATWTMGVVSDDMWIFPLIFLVIMLIFLARGRGMMCGNHGMQDRGRGMSGREESAREIFDRRYARGEISQEDYQRMRKEVE